MTFINSPWIIRPSLNIIVSDNKEDVDKLYEDCSQSDLIVTIGGVSKGDFDLIRDAISSKGVLGWG